MSNAAFPTRPFAKSFKQTWAFESEMLARYPAGRIKYGSEVRVSKNGKALRDWQVFDKMTLVATHTMMILHSKKNGAAYAVVSRDANATVSEELKAILAVAGTAKVASSGGSDSEVDEVVVALGATM
jgi:hypothetical protein